MIVEIFRYLSEGCTWFLDENPAIICLLWKYTQVCITQNTYPYKYLLNVMTCEIVNCIDIVSGLFDAGYIRKVKVTKSILRYWFEKRIALSHAELQKSFLPENVSLDIFWLEIYGYNHHMWLLHRKFITRCCIADSSHILHFSRNYFDA